MSLALTTLILALFGFLAVLLGLAAGDDIHGPVADIAPWIFMGLLILAIAAMRGVVA